MDKDSSRNTITFMVIAAALLVAYQVLVLGPSERRREAAQRTQAAQAQAAGDPAAAPPGSPVLVTRQEAAARSPRVAVDTPALQGSVSLRGARFDDLFLKAYRETLAKDSPPVELFRPEGAKQAYFADFGWTGAVSDLPGPQTLWTQTGGTTLAPGRPVVLSFDNGRGLVFTRTISVDDRYVFTVADGVRNAGAAPVRLAAYASVQRQGRPQLTPSINVFEGAVGSLGGTVHLDSYKNMKSKGEQTASSVGGWLGLTDNYWLAALIPPRNEAIQAAYKLTNVGDVEVYEANYTGPVRTLAPGATLTETRSLFAGAKKVTVLADYEKSLGLPQFTSAVDWGLFWFLTRPIFWVLSTFQSLTGNFGVSLLLLTVMVKLVTFPLYNKSYASMARMKRLQPRVNEIKKRFDKDPAKQQQETMALYKSEHVNPLAGCVPALIPIPIFLALIKVLSVSLEMRHAPFFGWIKDLSAPDPSSIWNLFGLLPFHPENLPAVGTFLGGPLHIGAWAILYGAVTWLSQAMNPQTSADPTQRQVAQFLPLMFAFFMAHVASGLLVYYAWSGLLSTVQQYYIMHRHKTENPIDSFIARLRHRPAPA